MFVFLHIPKTAGQTLISILEDQHPARWSVLKKDQWNPKAAAQSLIHWNKTHPQAAQIFYGHQHYGVHAYLPAPVTYYTLLRDPIERAVSHYHHVLRKYILSDTREGTPNKHPDRQRVLEGGLSLEEYVSSGYCAEMDNGQTRLLAGESGLYDQVPFGQCTPALLEQAKRNLTDRMGVVGLTEHFDASLILIQRLCGWYTPYYRSHNVTPQRPRRDEISPEARLAIEEQTVLDRQLYDFGVQLFHEQVAAQGPGFADDLRRFQERNRRWGAWHVRLAAVRRAGRQAGRFASDRLPRLNAKAAERPRLDKHGPDCV